jgi:hypothetical protein
VASNQITLSITFDCFTYFSEEMMKTRTKSLLTIVAVLAFSLIFFVGSALAQDDAPGEDAAAGGWLPQMQQHMEERFGEGAWGEMIARMTERHGAEFTAERLQWMDENGCPMLNGEGGHGPKMRRGAWHSQDSDEANQSGQGYGRGSRMMGQGMMGQGMMHDGGGRGLMRGWMMESQGE